MRVSRLPQKILMEIVVQRFPKGFEDISPPWIKQLLKNCRLCSVQIQGNTQQMLLLSKLRSIVAFFGSPLPVSEEFTQTFWKNALRWRGLQRMCASRRMTHASPVRELNLPCCSMLPTSKHRQHCCAGFLQKHSFVLWEETNCSHCQSKLKQSASAERINMHQPACTPWATFPCLPSAQKALPDLYTKAIQEFWQNW